MDNPKNDPYYFGKLIQDLNFIKEHMADKDIHDLDADEVLLEMLTFPEENSKE